MAAKKAAPKKAPAKRTGSNGLIPPPPSKKETAKRNVLNAMKANLVIEDERRSASKSPSFSTRQRVNDLNTAQAIWNYKESISGGSWLPTSRGDIKKAVQNRWNEAEAQAGLRGKNLSSRMKDTPTGRKALSKNRSKKVR